MKRLVYSPKINVYIKSDAGVIDLSPFVLGCDVERRVNQVSSLSVTFNNPKLPDGRKMFTDWKYAPTTKHGKTTYGPLFHPMDPIICTLTRLNTKPVHVFTGYIDKAPYVQLRPGPATLTASCTLKRLQYTFWDPGLFYVKSFLAQFGWLMNDQGINALTSAEQKKLSETKGILTDSGFSDLLYAVLVYVGGWDKKNIYIEKLPPGIIDTVVQLFKQFEAENKEAEQEFQDLLKKIIGTESRGGGSADPNSGDGSSNSIGGPVKGEREIVNTIVDVATRKGIPPLFALTVCWIESAGFTYGTKDNALGYRGWYQWDSLTGPPGSYSAVGVRSSKPNGAYDLQFSCESFCDAARKWVDKVPGIDRRETWYAWAGHIQGVYEFGSGLRPPTSALIGSNFLYTKAPFDAKIDDAQAVYNRNRGGDPSKNAATPAAPR